MFFVIWRMDLLKYCSFAVIFLGFVDDVSVVALFSLSVQRWKLSHPTLIAQFRLLFFAMKSCLAATGFL